MKSKATHYSNKLSELEPLPQTTWPWQRSLQIRVILAYTVMFTLVLATLTWWISRIVFENQIEQSEHMLEIEAFLISNALEDSLSGFTPEFDQYLRFLHQNTDMPYLIGTWEVDDFLFVVDDETMIEERSGGLAIGGCATITYERDDNIMAGRSTIQSNYRVTNVRSITCDNKLYIHSNPIEIYAQVDRLPEEHPQGFWQVGGIDYRADAASEIDGNIRLGQCVEIKYSASELPYRLLELEDTDDHCPRMLQMSGAIDALPQTEEPLILNEAAKQKGIPEMPRLQRFIKQQAQDSATTVTIVDIWGNVMVNSDYPSTLFENQFYQVEVQAALQGTEQHNIRTNPLTDEPAIHVAVPIQQSNRRLGLVHLTRAVQDATTPARNLILGLIFASLLALFIIIGIGYFLSRQLVAPVRRLERAALAIAEGDLDQQVTLDSGDELGSLARTFNHMARELKKAFEQQRLFIANASHELRTPLTNIRLRSDVLLRLDQEPQINIEYLQDISTETMRLERLSAELLDITRLDSMAQDSKFVDDFIPKLNINKHLTRLYQTIKLRAEASQIDLNYRSFATPELYFAIQPYDLDTIIINLLNNAIKYTASGGQVELIVDRDQPATEQSDILQISVKDTGIGIPTDDLPHIFDRFYRVDKARSRVLSTEPSSSGAGLGLALVKAAVDKYDGEITVESTVDLGSTFTVSFELE